jgi:hypothetical protein
MDKYDMTFWDKKENQEQANKCASRTLQGLDLTP